MPTSTVVALERPSNEAAKTRRWSVRPVRGKALPTQVRRLLLIVHRYVGLLLAVFLAVAGLTGCLLVFYDELDRICAAELRAVAPPRTGATLLPPFALASHIQQNLPEATLSVSFEQKGDTAQSVWVESAPGSWREAFVDPYTGKVLGSRHWGDLSEGWVNLMPFVYRFHYSLALGDTGIVLFGIIALLWTIDCFVGAYLTFPISAQRQVPGRSNWLRRWLPAWMIKTQRLFALVFTWHRASGLWLWAMLLVFAWSAVGLNLGPVYEPVMGALLGTKARVHDTLPELPRPHPAARFTAEEAHAIGRRLMATEVERRGFHVVRERYLYHAAEHGVFVYVTQSSLDISAKYPQTEVYFDARDGHLVGFDAATGIAPGNTVTSWLYALHFAAAFGLWYRLLVVVLGALVAALSVTGAWIWWVKQRRPARAT